MKTILLSLTGVVVRFLLSLRYRIRVEGLDAIPRQRGVLILPNHPAELDPPIIESLLWPRYHPRPLIIEDFYYMPVLHPFLRLIGAIPMPNQSLGTGTYKRLRVKEGLDRVVEALEQGDSILLYPSGAIMRSGKENLRGASAVSEILARLPDVPVVLVRTRGLIGSSFSWTAHRQRPDLVRWLKHGLGCVIRNFVFFVPKRPVHIKCISAPPEFPRHGDKMEINQWLEDWYNADGEEPISLYSYSCFREILLDVVKAKPADDGGSKDVDAPAPLRKQVMKELARRSGRPLSELEPGASLSQDLGLDSLDLGDLVTWLEETFFASDVEGHELVTCNDVVAAAAGVVRGQTAGAPATVVPGIWHAARSQSLWVVPNMTEPIHSQFLSLCDQMPDAAAIADEVSGVLTYRRAKTAVILLASIISEESEKYVGIMLPASAGANLLIMATLLAGKVPVMINWTLGMANLKHVLELSGCKIIYTSGRFLDRIDDLDVDYLNPFLCPVEELRRSRITLMDKLRALWRARKGTAAILRLFETDPSTVHDPAVILFTSGSEAVPKGVPLTHENILANIIGSLGAVPSSGDDRMFGFLPPFHSFGFTTTVIMPMITGMRAVYHPNPTQSRKIASMIAAWKPTMICGTPTFIAGILRAVQGSKVDSLRLIFAGAEKVPDELFAQVEILTGATILEGYGITECSPALTINRVGSARAGVGHPIGDVEIHIVNPETREPIAQGENGLILVRGTNIFNGYLGRDSSAAFHTKNGESWYITGDLGHLDPDGNLFLAGRMKRFIKVGGEMISLQAIEDAIETAVPCDEGELNLALAYVEDDGTRPVMTLFNTFNTTVDAVNHILKDAGFSNLARVQHVRCIDEIPLLGTGKVDYRTLTAMLTSE